MCIFQNPHTLLRDAHALYHNVYLPESSYVTPGMPMIFTKKKKKKKPESLSGGELTHKLTIYKHFQHINL